MEPISHEIDFEIILNKLSLLVRDSRIIQLSGFCGLANSMQSDCEVPSFKKGALKVIQEMQHGFAYGLNDDDLPIHINIKTGWVCIGDSNVSDFAVEFIEKCVAVVGKNENLIALWLKPAELPSYLLG